MSLIIIIIITFIHVDFVNLLSLGLAPGFVELDLSRTQSTTVSLTATYCGEARDPLAVTVWDRSVVCVHCTCHTWVLQNRMNQSRCWARPRKPCCFMWRPDTPFPGKGIFRGITQPIVKYKECPAWTKFIWWMAAAMRHVALSTAATCSSYCKSCWRIHSSW